MHVSFLGKEIKNKYAACMIILVCLERENGMTSKVHLCQN